MSFKLTVQAFEARVGNPLRKLILIKLADQANDQGVCWPSYETIAHHCEAGRRSVISHIQQLEKDGFLTIEKVYDKEKNQNKSNRYHLTIEQGKAQIKDKKSKGSAKNAPRGVVQDLHHPSANDALGVVQDLHHPSANDAPEPINEPTNKPINETISSDFQKFWDLYDKKTDTGKCRKKWEKISDSDKKLIFEHVPKYVASTPDKKFRKNPLTYLNGECWLDEILPTDNQNNNNVGGSNNANNQSANKDLNNQPARQPSNHFDSLRQELATKYGSDGYTNNGIKTVN